MCGLLSVAPGCTYPPHSMACTSCAGYSLENLKRIQIEAKEAETIRKERGTERHRTMERERESGTGRTQHSLVRLIISTMSQVGRFVPAVVVLLDYCATLWSIAGVASLQTRYPNLPVHVLLRSLEKSHSQRSCVSPNDAKSESSAQLMGRGQNQI